MRFPKVGYIRTSEWVLSVPCSVMQQPDVSESTLLCNPQVRPLGVAPSELVKAG